MSDREGTPQEKSDETWLDLEPFEDCVAWVDIREVTGPAVPFGEGVRWRLVPASAGWDFTMRVWTRPGAPDDSKGTRGEGDD